MHFEMSEYNLVCRRSLTFRRLTIVQPAVSYIVNSHAISVSYMPNLDFHTQLMNKHIELSHSGTVCQPSQHLCLCMLSATLLSVFIS